MIKNNSFLFTFQRRELNDLMTNDFDRVLTSTNDMLKVFPIIRNF
jgi:hypothetical protein